MKIAVSTEDGVSICGHLGHVSKFIVYEVNGNTITSKELRQVTPVHGPGEHHHDHNHHHGGHGGLVTSLSDCSTVITNGMGGPMAAALHGAGIDPVVTRESDPDVAVAAYLVGSLEKGGTCEHHH